MKAPDSPSNSDAAPTFDLFQIPSPNRLNLDVEETTIKSTSPSRFPERDSSTSRNESLSRGSRTPDSMRGTTRSSSRGINNKTNRLKGKSLDQLIKKAQKFILYPKTIQRIFKAIGAISIVELHERLLSNQLCFSDMNEDELKPSMSSASLSTLDLQLNLNLSQEEKDQKDPKPNGTTETKSETDSGTVTNSNGVPLTLNKMNFDVLFREILKLSTSRHKRWILDNPHNIGRLFYTFDLYNTSKVNGPEFLCTIAALSSGSLEEKISFCFDVVADDVRDSTTQIKKMNAMQTVMLFRGFTNQGSNWTISEALGQVEQFGTDVVEDARSGGHSQGLRMQSESGKSGSSANLVKLGRNASTTNNLNKDGRKTPVKLERFVSNESDEGSGTVTMPISSNLNSMNSMNSMNSLSSMNSSLKNASIESIESISSTTATESGPISINRPLSQISTSSSSSTGSDKMLTSKTITSMSTTTTTTASMLKVESPAKTAPPLTKASNNCIPRSQVPLLIAEVGYLSEERLENRVMNWFLAMDAKDNEGRLTLKQILDCVLLAPKAMNSLPESNKDLSKFLMRFSNICNTYATSGITSSTEAASEVPVLQRDVSGSRSSSLLPTIDITVEGTLQSQLKKNAMIQSNNSQSLNNNDGHNGSNNNSEPSSLQHTSSNESLLNGTVVDLNVQHQSNSNSNQSKDLLTDEEDSNRSSIDNARLLQPESDDDDDEEDDGRIIRLGICARDKKTKAKPMQNILKRMPSTQFECILFDDEMVDNLPVEEWPIVDCLIAFFSSGFPLAKAQEYIALRKPWTCNDLNTENVLRDRRRVYDHLQRNAIPVPKHVFCNRDNYDDAEGTEHIDPEVEEFDDYIIVNNTKINKPLVEKPVDGEDHNIYVYYPMRTGGGSKRLFRKVGDRASQFYKDVNDIRRDGSYIYEEFLSTGGTDIKVYTCGPNYAHAEARKAPTLDGKVQRDENNKERRFPIVLNMYEKLIARKVVLAFGMNVCGFDILKCQNKSYVCDVNGFSFVKSSTKYYDDAALILCDLMSQAMGRNQIDNNDESGSDNEADEDSRDQSSYQNHQNQTRSISNNRDHPPSPGRLHSRTSSSIGEDGNPTSTNKIPGHQGGSKSFDTNGGGEGEGGNVDGRELRCVVAVVRHGDRTPKEKMKMVVSDSLWMEFFKFFGDGSPRTELKLKSPSELQSVLDCARRVLKLKLNALNESNNNDDDNEDNEDDDDDQNEQNKQNNEIIFKKEEADEEEIEKLQQLITVLEKGHFSGINRKVQFKPLKWKVTQPSDVIGGIHSSYNIGEATASPLLYPLDNSKSTSSTVNSPPSSPQTSKRTIHHTKIPSPMSLTPINTKFSSISNNNTKKSLQVDSSSSSSSGNPSTNTTNATDNGYISSSQLLREPIKQEEVIEAQLILKWGGVLTHKGRVEAEKLGVWGREFLYPGDEDNGLLRLHATFRHDLKIYSSGEGRVVTTAAAFAKGFLDLDGALTPIIHSLVRADPAVDTLLDDAHAARAHLHDVKKRLHAAIQGSDRQTSKYLTKILAPTGSRSLVESIRLMRTPMKALTRLRELIGDLVEQLKSKRNKFKTLFSDDDDNSDNENKTNLTMPMGSPTGSPISTSPVMEEIKKGTVGEEINLIYARWKKLHRDLCKVKKDKSKKKDKGDKGDKGDKKDKGDKT